MRRGMIQTSDDCAAIAGCRMAGRSWVAALVQLMALGLVIGLPHQGFAQKRSDRSKNTGKSDSRDVVGPKRTDRTVPESERVKVITKTEFVKVVTKADKGYLSVVAIPSASVTLNALAAADQKKAPAIKETVKDLDGSLNLINLLPGKYRITIEHPDYNPYSDTIQVDPARPETFVALNKMISRYGEIRIGGAPAGAKVFLDEMAISITPAMSDGQGISLSRIAVGKHRLRISKDGYVDLNSEIEVSPVPPGKQTFVSAQLDLAKVTLNLNSQPGGRVYIGTEEKAIIPSNGYVTISLPPGQHKLMVSKEGFQDWRKDLTLSLAKNPVTETADLIPVPVSTEGDWQPSLGARKWYPPTSSWKFAASGAMIKGDQLVLFDTEPSRTFNTYRDFRLEFDVVFANDKGVAWAVRARDVNNYYLFEISTATGKIPVLNFYICRDGKLQWLDSRPVVEKMDKKGDSFHFIFEARGARFDTSMTIASSPSTKPLRVGVFQDDSFSYGGVGFRGKDLSESLLQTFFVIPIN